MVNFKGRPEPYHSHQTHTMGANAAHTLRHDMVPEGCILEVFHLTATGNNSGSGEYVNLGLTRGGRNFFLEEVVNTGNTAEIVTLSRRMYLIEGDQPVAYWAAGNSTEVLETVCHGILWYLNK